jgi:diacylglycerol O-acyltransferase / wax synthase
MPAQRLSALDASFLYLEQPTMHMHVGGVAVLDPSDRPGGALRFEDLEHVITSRLHLVPRFRQKVLFVPGNVARPVWADDPEFDVEFHLRRAALPAPGSHKELADFVQRVFSRPLDRSKPLWEMYFVEGLEDGLACVVTKVHHAMIDGMSGIDIATVLLDFAPEPQVPVPQPFVPDPEPSRMELLQAALAEQVRNPVAMATGTVQAALRTPMKVLGGVGAALGGVRELIGMGAPPKGPFDGRVGANRRFAMADSPVERFKEIKNAAGGTVNDVVLATVAGALSKLLKSRREPTRGRTLRAMVPVSVRSEDEKMALGNRVSMIFVDLPVGPIDPVNRLHKITETTKDLKDSMMAVGADAIMNLGQYAPPTLHALAARLVSRGRWFNLVVSNVPGPQIPMYIAGARLLANYPVMPTAENVGLSIAVTSLAGTMGFGFTGDWDLMPDIDFLAASFEEAVDELAKAAGV